MPSVMRIDTVLDAVHANGWGFRLDGDRLVLTGVVGQPDEKLALAIRHHKPAIIAMLSNPLVSGAMECFGIATARPMSAKAGAEAWPEKVSQVWGNRVYSDSSAPAPTAASVGGAKRD